MATPTDLPHGEPVYDIPITKVDTAPLQSPGRHRCLQVIELGGPAARQDRRMYLDRRELEQLLDIAKASINGRVQIDFVGLRVKHFQAQGDHVYEVWSFFGQPKAEMPSVVAGLVG